MPIDCSGAMPITEFTGARHAKVCYISCAVGQHAASEVCTCVCVPQTALAFPVEQEAHGALFARGLGVQIDKDYLLAYLLHVSVGNNEGIIRVRIEREASHEVDDAHRRSSFINVYAAAGALRREVRRAQDALFLLEIRLQLIARPRVVAERDDVGPGGEDRVGLLRRHADDVGVFAVDDDKNQAQAPCADGAFSLQPRLAHNVADGKNFALIKKSPISWK